MTRFGYTLMTEQSGPKELVRYAVSAEHRGFDFEVSSDHFSPWLCLAGPCAERLDGAGRGGASHRAGRSDDLCDLPDDALSPGDRRAAGRNRADPRRRPIHAGLGSGENLNEHVVGQGWPAIERRQDMLRRPSRSSANCSAANWSTGRATTSRSTRRGCGTCRMLRSGSAWRCRARRSVETFAPLADHLIAVEPDGELVADWHAARKAAALPGESRVIGQIPICWDPDRDAAVERAHDQFRWFGGGWDVNADLPTTAGFAGATQFVRPKTWPTAIPCGPDLDAIVDAVRPYWEAGFTDIALVQIGGESQDLFLKEAAEPLLAALRTAATGKNHE